MDEQRHPAGGGAVQQRRHALEPAARDEGAGRDRDAGRACVERRVDVPGVDLVQRQRAPVAERPAELAHALVERVQQRRGFLARQRLDAQRARQAHQRALEAFVRERGGAGGRIVRGELEALRRLAVEAEGPLAGAAVQPRGRAAARQLGDEALRPEVLVDVGAGHGPGYKQKPVGIYRFVSRTACGASSGIDPPCPASSGTSNFEPARSPPCSAPRSRCISPSLHSS